MSRPPPSCLCCRCACLRVWLPLQPRKWTRPLTVPNSSPRPSCLSFPVRGSRTTDPCSWSTRLLRLSGPFRLSPAHSEQCPPRLPPPAPHGRQARPRRWHREADTSLAPEALSSCLWHGARRPISHPGWAHWARSGPDSPSAGSRSSSRRASGAVDPGDSADLAHPPVRLRAGTPVPKPRASDPPPWAWTLIPPQPTMSLSPNPRSPGPHCRLRARDSGCCL